MPNSRRKWRKSCAFTARSRSSKRPRPAEGASDAVAIVSYDEKPGVQAIGATAPDLPPKPGVHASFWARSRIRPARCSLLAGIDLLTGKVHALVKDRHRVAEFIEFLELLDKAYPTSTRDQS